MDRKIERKKREKKRKKRRKRKKQKEERTTGLKKTRRRRRRKRKKKKKKKKKETQCLRKRCACLWTSQPRVCCRARRSTHQANNSTQTPLVNTHDCHVYTCSYIRTHKHD